MTTSTIRRLAASLLFAHLVACQGEPLTSSADADAGAWLPCSHQPADLCTVYPAGAPATGSCLPLAGEAGTVQCCSGGDPLACLSGCEAASDQTAVTSFRLRGVDAGCAE